MKYLKIIYIVLIIGILSSCTSDLNEPNTLAYITAMGIDELNDKNFKLTIQFAKPTQISGGASEEGGKGGEIIENITVEAPTLYSGISIANHVLSKKLSLAHVQLIVFSENIAKKGVGTFAETLIRSHEIRPNVYLAVAENANEYLKEVKPVVEINPARYYQLIYEKNNFGGIPINVNKEFAYKCLTEGKASVLPLSGVLKTENKKSEEGENSNKQDESKDSSKVNIKKEELQNDNVNEKTFEFGIKDYYAGEVAIEEDNKTETMGMALFKDDKMVGKLGSIDAQIYNMVKGNFDYSFIALKPENLNEPVTIKMYQRKKPKIFYDKATNTAKIHLDYDGIYETIPRGYKIESDQKSFEESARRGIEEYVSDFMYKTSRVYNADVTDIERYVKEKFLTYPEFSEYNWDEKYNTIKFDISVEFNMRRTGLILVG